MASANSLIITTSMSFSYHNLFTILLALSFIISTLHPTYASSSNSTKTTTNSLKIYKAFIKGSCSSTTYPKDCYKSLSPYASMIKTNPLVLTKISMNLALKATRIASSTMTKLSKLKGLTHGETLVIGDCKENVDDSLDEVQQSATAIKGLNGTSTEEDQFQWDNIKTWMSAAITDDSTCTDEFDEMEVRPSLQKKIKTNIETVSRMISNALALVNKFTNG